MRHSTASCKLACVSFALGLGISACGDEGPGTGGEQEVITTLTINLTGPSNVTATAKDEDGTGTLDSIDDITLMPGTYTAEVIILNETVDPAEDVTEEIKEEAEEHLIFYSGSAIGSALTVTITDKETDYGMNAVGDDLAVGLRSTWTATAGMGMLTVQLQHLPPVNEMPQKTATTTMNDGDVDISAGFAVTVQ